MADEPKDYKVVKAPRGTKRINIVPKSSQARLRDDEYQRELEYDFNEDRHMYETVFIHGVPVKVKVAPK